MDGRSQNPIAAKRHRQTPAPLLLQPEEQAALIGHGLRLLREVGAATPSAFRSGSFACNEDTFPAVAANGLRFDSSIEHGAYPCPAPRNRHRPAFAEPFIDNGLEIYPMTLFRDGFGRLRHAQIGACSARELMQAMESPTEPGGPPSSRCRTTSS